MHLLTSFSIIYYSQPTLRKKSLFLRNNRREAIFR
jgi:hypothetical protein